MEDMGLWITIDWIVEQGACDVQFSRPSFGLEEHRTAAFAAGATAAALFGNEPAQRLFILYLHLCCGKSNPGHKGRAMRALASRAMAMRSPQGWKFGSKGNQSAEATAIGTIVIHPETL